MDKKNWKNGIALGLALAIVLGTGVLNSANWLHAGEAEAAPEAAATEAAPAQGATVTETIVVPEAPAPMEAPAPAPTEAPAEPAQPQSQVTEQIKPTEPVQETKPVEETKPAEESKPVEETKAVEETQPAEQSQPTEETEPAVQTEPTEETELAEQTEPTEETQPEELPLPAAQLPMVVTLVDAQGQSVGQGKWETAVTFAEGETTARLTPPQIEGYTAPELTVERTAETTALEVQAVYQLAEKTPEQLLAEALDPNRSVKVTFDVPEGGLNFGDTVKLKAEISGYDDVTYTLQWRWSTDNENWHEITGQTGNELLVEVTPDNYQYYWNVLVTVTGLKDA